MWAEIILPKGFGTLKRGQKRISKKENMHHRHSFIDLYQTLCLWQGQVKIGAGIKMTPSAIGATQTAQALGDRNKSIGRRLCFVLYALALRDSFRRSRHNAWGNMIH